ncbi:MAG: DCC1-like thiol-disulfide oxidoreductase family protein [Flavobacteriaceae bacterium]
MKKNHKIILFDGVCNLCNASVNFVIQRDKNDVFRFVALQSEIGKKYISEFNIDPLDTDSIILIDEDKCYIKSTAALHITKSMSGGYPLLFGFIIVPKFIRNWVYDYVAKNRYKWYGKTESCMIPTSELKRKFL